MQIKITQQIKYVLQMCRKYLVVFSFWSIALLGLYNTVNYGLASLHFYSVKNTVSAWQINKKLNNEVSYKAAKKSIIQAQKQHPAHPLYTDLAAQIYEWGVIGGYEETSTTRILSKRLYMQAAKMRPTWPVTYASLAMNKWRSNEFDAELANYLLLADRYGPKKAEVNILFVEIGLALYQSNHPFYAELRPYLKQRISQGIHNSQSRPRVIAAIQHYRALRTVCRWMDEEAAFVTSKGLKCDRH